MASTIFTQAQISASQSSKHVTANENFASLKNGIRGLLSKSVAGAANVTLTEAECENAIIELTGAITANIELRVVAYSKLYAIYNNTSGAFSVTVKTVSGSGVVVAQGRRVVLYCNGTNIVAFSFDSAFTGDSGSGGLLGLVPAPAAGDAAAGKYLKADGTWAVPPGGGGGGGAPTTATYVVSAADGTLSNEIVIPAMAGHPDIKPSSPATEDDEFDAGSLEVKWTWHNQGTATASLALSHLKLSAAANSAVSVKAIVQTAPSPPYTVGCKVSLHGVYNDFHSAGLALLENATGKLTIFVVGHNSAQTGSFCMAVYSFTNATTFSATRFINRFDSMGPVYLKAQDDNTNLNFSFSLDGRNYHQVYTMTRATGFTTAADRVGLSVHSQNATYGADGSFDWFRRTA